MYRNGQIDVMTLYLIVGIGFGVLFAVPVILCAVFVRERVDVPEKKQKLLRMGVYFSLLLVSRERSLLPGLCSRMPLMPGNYCIPSVRAVAAVPL